MRVLLDNCVDVRFARLIDNHEVVHTLDRRWGHLTNGDLLAVAESAGFEVLVTVDKKLRFQQDFSKRAITLVTLNSIFVSYDHIAPLAPTLQAELDKGMPAGTALVIEP